MNYSTAVQDVNEPVKVLASFESQHLRIHFFSWNNRIYKVDRFNLLHESKDGGTRQYHFAVSASGNDYQLSFNPIELEWRLERLCSA